MDTSQPYALKARYIFPIESPPLCNGLLTVAGDRIVAVGQNASGHRARDLGNVAIVPGLINAHTHLEFSDLQTPFGEAGMQFPDWIRLVNSRMSTFREVRASFS